MTNADVSDRLVSESRERLDLTASEIAEMWQLFAYYYGGVDREQFLADLFRKTHVILCRDGAGRIGGFSTIEVGEHTFAGRQIGILFSGDTIIRHEYWARNDLALSWIRFASQVKVQRPDEPLFWFLIVKGHRTYRYLSAFAQRYYPSPQWATTPRAQALMESLATLRFGDCYLREEGLIRFSTPHGHLRTPWSAVPENARTRKEVAYFLERNPGYQRGDELVCLSEVSRENMKPMARRVFDEVAGNAHRR
jgi:hypothetical protein